MKNYSGGVDMNDVKYLIFDWGDTLMIDYSECQGAMVMWERVAPMPEVIETMPLLSEMLPCAVASNAVESDAELMKQAFERIGLDHYFSFFITSKELGANKPSDSFFKGIAAKTNYLTKEMCVVGNDYTKDIVGAKNVGMKTILITDRQGDFPCADYVITSFGRLLEIFETFTQ